MKKPMVDYRQFRFSKLNTPEFSHLKLLGGWIVYFILYFLTENLIPAERCHLVHSALDDLIPFHEGFAIPYCLWFLLIAVTLVYFLLWDVDSFRGFQLFIIVTQLGAMLVYIVWPSVQDLRPTVFPRDNFLTHVMAFIYAFDTPTGVCPSLHVAYSIGMASAWCKCKSAPRAWKCFIVVAAVVISIATAFVKQHSVIDIFAAIPLCVLAELLAYHVFLPRLTNRRN